eukprot:gene16663-22917_t
MAEGNPMRRLMIREMVLDNFKSYAGPQHVGPFHKSFSSVVGPNGSGKSNVIDAMMFVFGRRAKQLRFNKVSELIHNSTNHKDLAFATVTVHFQEILDKSDYYMNGKKATTKEVSAWLKEKGIDLENNRFLILQGEVELISMMKPKAEDKSDTGLLEYLEDIIGTDQYVTPIEEGSKLLEEINDRRQSMIQRLKISEKEKDSLEGKKNEAEDFLDKQAEMLRSKAIGIQLDVRQTEQVLEKLEQSRSELEAKLAHERSKHQSYEKDHKEKEKRFVDTDKEHTAIQKALEVAQEEFKAFERKDAKIQMEIKHLKQKLKKLKAKAETDLGNVAKLEAEVAQAETDIPKCKAQVETLTAELSTQEAQLEAMLESIKGEVEGYHQQLSQHHTQLEAMLESIKGEVEGYHQQLSQHHTQLEAMLESIKGEVEGYHQQLSQHHTQLEAMLESIKGEVEGYHQQLSQHHTQLEAMLESIKGEVEGYHQQLSQHHTQLEAMLESIKGEVEGYHQPASESHHTQLEAMLESIKGEVEGYHQQLSQVGSWHCPGSLSLGGRGLVAQGRSTRQNWARFNTGEYILEPHLTKQQTLNLEGLLRVSHFRETGGGLTSAAQQDKPQPPARSPRLERHKGRGVEGPVGWLSTRRLRQDTRINILTPQHHTQLEAMLESIKGEVEGYHQQLSQVRAELAPWESSGVRAELAPWEKRRGEVNSRINVASTERDLLARKGEDAKKRLDSALQGLTAAQQGARAKEAQIKELDDATQRCRIQIEETTTERDSQRKEETRLDGTVKEARDKLSAPKSDARDKVSTFKSDMGSPNTLLSIHPIMNLHARDKVSALKSDMGSQQHQSGLVAALSAAKAKGEVSGVYGRLGDLGAIDAKYDVAVSTAVGALDFIVVETASDAQRCVEYLRKHNLGVATFLILEKQRHLASAMAEKVDAPEGAPRLYDLVKFKDERLRPAFSTTAMGHTAMAT